RTLMGRARRVKIQGLSRRAGISSGRALRPSSHRLRGAGACATARPQGNGPRTEASNMNVKTLLRPSLLCAAFPAYSADQVVVGLITKTEVNPFFVKMKEGADRKSTRLNSSHLVISYAVF